MNPFAYDFMIHAYLAATAVAVLAAATGYPLVLRGQGFAGHALGHVGFAGATGALLLGLPPLPGLLAVTTIGGALMGAAGPRLTEQDTFIGLVLAAALGLGLLFLNFFTGSAAAATALLFGNVLGVDAATLRQLAAITALALALLAAQSRPLLFASLQPDIAAAAGVNLRLQGMLFLAITGLAVAAAAQIVGVLLVFSLLIAPAATAQRLTARLWPGLGLTLALALAQALGGVTLAFYTDWPTSFWITALGVGFYAAALAAKQK